MTSSTSLCPINPHPDDHQENFHTTLCDTVLGTPGLAATSHLTPAFRTILSTAQVDAPGWGVLEDSAGCPMGDSSGNSWWPGKAAWHAEPRSMPRHPSLCSPICPPVPICWVVPRTTSAPGLTLTFCFAFLQAQHEPGPGPRLSRAATTPRATQTRTRFQIPCS